MSNKLSQSAISHPDGGIVVVYGEIAEQYKVASIAYHSAECRHPRKQYRLRTNAGGSAESRQQCLDCGSSIGNAIKRTGDEPDWEQGANDSYREKRTTEYEALRLKFIRMQEKQNEELKLRSKDWRAEYEAYRRTPVWQEKRIKVFKRANGVCEGCLDAQAAVVHHLTYANMGDELLFQLVALCHPCHQKAHPEHHEPEFYDNDYVPCAQCRWGGDAIVCAKLDRPIYEALSADGECGLTAKEFEALR